MTSPIDEETFRKRVKEQIINTFGSLIPDDQFAKMVDEQIKAFFESSVEMTLAELPQQGGYYGSKRQKLSSPVTPFQQMVWLQLMKLVEVRLNAYMSDTNTTHPITTMLDKLFKLPEFENHQALTAQQMMLAMAGQFFESQLRMSGVQAKNSVATVFINSGMPDIGSRIMHSA